MAGVKRQWLLWILAVAILLAVWTERPMHGRAEKPPDQVTLQDREHQAKGLATDTAVKIDPDLLKQVLAGEEGHWYRFIAVLADQVTFSSLPDDLLGSARRYQVVASLQDTAQESQADLLAFLQARQVSGQVQQIHPFWIFNGLAVTADADTLLTLAARPDIRFIHQDHWRRWVDPFSAPPVPVPSATTGLEWNIARIRADLAWSALGLDGNGVTVAILDTGVDWQHPALQAQYRGYHEGGLTIHEGNWFCTTDEGYLYPVDSYGHGTHVTGIAVGGQDSTGTAIGVAPGAQWIAVKTLNDSGYGYDSWIHAAFEWVLAPAGDPALAPNVVNASWGNTNASDETFRPDLQALRAAGIVPIFSAGNEGPATSSLCSPGSYPEAITVGATDDLDQVVSFSSRGPSPWGEIKPEIVAPGIQIRSSLPGGRYDLHNGTSMAAPHVTGLVALLLQADPTLSVDDIERILTTTAQPLGDELPNNDTGWGRIDAYRAAAVALQAGTIAGQIRRQPDGEPLPTAQIGAFDHLGTKLATVDADDEGHYRLDLPPGRYDLEITAFGYASQTVPDVNVQTGITTTVACTLAPLPTGVLWGQVSNADTNGPVEADLRIVGTPAQTSSNPQTGHYSLALPTGVYTLEVTRNGYRRHTTQDVEIVADEATRLDIALDPAPTLLLVDSGRWYYRSQIHYFEQALKDGDYVYTTWSIQDLPTDLPHLDDLLPYDITIWSAPLDAPGLIGAGNVISNYLGSGGNLFLSGQDVGYWDDGLSGLTWHWYYSHLLQALAVADDAGRGNLLGQPDDIWRGLDLPLNGPDSAANQSLPDEIAVRDPDSAALIAYYEGAGGGALRVQGCQSYRAVYLAAGLEGLGDRTTRAEVMTRTLDWLATPQPAVDLRLSPDHQEAVWTTGTALTYTVELRNLGCLPDRFNFLLASSGWDASLWDADFAQPLTQSMVLSACQTQTVGIQVTVPAGVEWNVTNTVTLTARSQTDPSRTAQAILHSKAPAPILLVDDHRWYDMSAAYQAALETNNLPYDLWRIPSGPHPETGSPPLARLQRHPLLLWFTAYDWHLTLTPDDEVRLAAYLDGGGRLLFSSQDYLYTNGLTSFARDYLGVAGYTESLSATQVVGASGSPITFGPDVLNLTYPFRNFSDALRPTLTALSAYWGQHGQPVALTLDQNPWKTAFFAFPLEALSANDMAALLGRTVGWLSPLGNSSLAVDRPVVAEGGQLTYTLTLRNSGPALLHSVTLSNSVPPSTTYVVGSLIGPATYDPFADLFTWEGALAPGQALTITYRLQVDADAPPGTVVQNIARLSDESGLHLDRAAVSRIAAPDLSASQIAATPEIFVGQRLTYTLVLRNDGLRSAFARLNNPIPPYTTYALGSAWTSSGTLTATTEALLWAGPLHPGQTATVTLAVIPTTAGLYAYNRAVLDDGWDYIYLLETATWVHARLFLPLVFRTE